MTAGRYLGQSIARVEDARLLTGTGRFVDDLDRAGQVYARIVRSHLARGRITGIDTAAAGARPGVLGVFTARDLPEVRIPVRLLPTDRAALALQSPLALDIVQYAGDPIAVVVAEDAYIAEDAAGDVIAAIEPLEAVMDTGAAAPAGAGVLHPALGSNLLDLCEGRSGEEGLEALFANAAVVVRETLHVHRHGSVPLEPRGLVAEYDPGTRRLTVWGVAKVTHFNRRALAQLLDLPIERVRVVEMDVGGGFGARGEFYPEDFLIPWLAMRLRRPIKWLEDRAENLTALNQSREQDWDVEMAADASGKLLAMRAGGLFSQGGYVRTHGSVLIPRIMVSHLPGPYRWGALDLKATGVLTNKTPAGTCRGPGQYEATYIRERMIDLVARELGLDPVEIRRRNFVTAAEMPYRPGVPTVRGSHDPVVYAGCDFERTFERLLQHLDYPKLRAEVSLRQSRGELVGLGFGTFVELADQGTFEQARVVPEADGTFIAHVGIASVGQGVETVLSQIAADRLGVPIELIRISHRDSDVIPEGQGAFASRSTVWGGRAIGGAIDDLGHRARAALAERLHLDPEKVAFAGGKVNWVDGTETGETELAELGVEGNYRYEPKGPLDVAMGANAALVELDAETGRVKVVRYAIALEVGRAINPLTLRGQIRGAAAQGIGGTLLEEFSYTADGQPQSTTFMDYMLATAVEIPDIDVLLIEGAEPDPDDAIAGAKGAGEGGIIGTGAAVANAVADALGAAGGQLSSLPITPELVQRLAKPRLAS